MSANLTRTAIYSGSTNRSTPGASAVPGGNERPDIGKISPLQVATIVKPDLDGSGNNLTAPAGIKWRAIAILARILKQMRYYAVLN